MHRTVYGLVVQRLLVVTAHYLVLVLKPRMRVSTLFVAGAALIGCAGSGPASYARALDCLASPAPPVPYVVREIPVNDEFVMSSGVSLAGREVMAFDLQVGNVRSFDIASGAALLQFGRTGDGPGEFQSFASVEGIRTFPSQWLETNADSLYSFDRRRIDAWVNGRVARSYPVPQGVDGAFAKVSALRFVGGQLFLGIERSPGIRSGVDDKGSVSLVPIVDSTDTPIDIMEFETLPWPRTDDGRLFRGFGEANPSWDAIGSCVVYVDGHSPRVIVASMNASRRDTVATALPERFADAASAERSASLGLQGKIPPPRFKSRVRAITIDSYGVVWLMPSRPLFDGEVWKVNLRTGKFAIDTSEVFPLRFYNDRRGVGLSRDSLGFLHIHQFLPGLEAQR